jgi:hypothetical protein
MEKLSDGRGTGGDDQKERTPSANAWLRDAIGPDNDDGKGEGPKRAQLTEKLGGRSRTERGK